MSEELACFPPCSIDVGVPGTGMWPVHEAERQFVNEQRLETFWESGWEPTG